MIGSIIKINCKGVNSVEGVALREGVLISVLDYSHERGFLVGKVFDRVMNSLIDGREVSLVFQHGNKPFCVLQSQLK